MNFSKRSNRVIAMVLSMLMVLTMTLSMMLTTVHAAQGKALDVIFVIDDTRSMQTTDPQRLSEVSIDKFSDLLKGMNDVRLGLATYSLSLMQTLPLGQTPEQIKQEKKITQDGAGTNAPIGFEWAVKELEAKSDSSRNPSIILIGDGANDFRGAAANAETEAEQKLADSIALAQAKGITVYPVAINPEDDECRQYFKGIASKPENAYELNDISEVETQMQNIYNSITGATSTGNGPIVVGPDRPVVQTFDVPDGVFEMSLQCDHEQPLEIKFISPDGTIYDKDTTDSNGKIFSQGNGYSTYRVKEPVAGQWKVEYKSKTKQTVTPIFVFHADVTVALSKNQAEVVEDEPVKYVATIMSGGEALTSDEDIKNFEAKLVVTPFDENGKAGKPDIKEMKVENGTFALEYTMKEGGKHEVYAELIGDKTTIKSNVLTLDVVVVPPPIPLWALILIIIGVLIILALITVLVIKSIYGDGTGYVRGIVSVKITGTLANGEVKIFDPARFNCEQIFTKKNTLSDLISAYTKWYRAIYSGDMAEITLNQFINSNLTEVTDKVSICGNKKKQTIVRIPAKNDMMVDGVEVRKPIKMAFSSAEKEIDFRFKNLGNSYNVLVVFTRDEY